MLESLKFVDKVVPFDEDTPLKLIELLKPDILVKGSDYTIESVVGAELVKEWGGKVVLVDILTGYSSTSLISKIRG